MTQHCQIPTLSLRPAPRRWSQLELERVHVQTQVQPCLRGRIFLFSECAVLNHYLVIDLRLKSNVRDFECGRTSLMERELDKILAVG